MTIILHEPINKNKTKDNLSKIQSEPEPVGYDRSSGWTGYSSLSLGGENRSIQAKQGNDRSQGWQPMSLSSLSQGGILQRKCACDSTGAAGTCGECQGKEGTMLQTKLSIGSPDDRYEREADRVADQVMSMSANSIASRTPPRIQRFTGASAGQSDMIAPASVDRVLSSPGKPLEPGLQQYMGQRFGHDFSRVRVHTGAEAARSARDINANAYTVGHNVVFGAGQYAVGTDDGQKLIAHELTHVIQQGAMGSYIQKQAANLPSRNQVNSPFACQGEAHDVKHNPYGFSFNILDSIIIATSFCINGTSLSVSASTHWDPPYQGNPKPEHFNVVLRGDRDHQQKPMEIGNEKKVVFNQIKPGYDYKVIFQVIRPSAPHRLVSNGIIQ
jgi:Domain of unknown function (DUF4157)